MDRYLVQCPMRDESKTNKIQYPCNFLGFNWGRRADGRWDKEWRKAWEPWETIENMGRPIGNGKTMENQISQRWKFWWTLMIAWYQVLTMCVFVGESRFTRLQHLKGDHKSHNPTSTWYILYNLAGCLHCLHLFFLVATLWAKGEVWDDALRYRSTVGSHGLPGALDNDLEQDLDAAVAHDVGVGGDATWVPPKGQNHSVPCSRLLQVDPPNIICAKKQKQSCAYFSHVCSPPDMAFPAPAAPSQRPYWTWALWQACHRVSTLFARDRTKD